MPRSGPAVLVQADAGHVPFAPAIATALADWLVTRPSTTIVVASQIDGEGDAEFARALAGSMTLPVLTLPAEAALEDVAAAVASSHAFIGSSPFGLALALSYGRPHVGLDLTETGALANFARTSANGAAFVVDAGAIAATLAAAPSSAHLIAVAGGIWGNIDRTFDELARHVVEAARARPGQAAPPPSAEYVAALEAAHRALQRRLLTERGLLADPNAAAVSDGTGPRLHQLWQLQKELDTTLSQLEQARAELDALRGTRTFRTLQPARRMYGRLRGLPK
jgi:hypothetical protein